jgi:hypothetical protein
MRAYLPLGLLVVGSALGGALMGIPVALGTWALAHTAALRLGILWGIGAISVAAIFVRALRGWLPQRACQVAAGTLMVGGKNRAALAWGTELGAGVCSFVVTPGFYALLGFLLASGRPLFAGALCASYGACRGATIAWFSATNSDSAANRRALRAGVGLERLTRVPLALIVLTGMAVLRPT